MRTAFDFLCKAGRAEVSGWAEGGGGEEEAKEEERRGGMRGYRRSMTNKKDRGKTRSYYWDWAGCEMWLVLLHVGGWRDVCDEKGHWPNRGFLKKLFGGCRRRSVVASFTLPLINWENCFAWYFVKRVFKSYAIMLFPTTLLGSLCKASNPVMMWLMWQ